MCNNHTQQHNWKPILGLRKIWLWLYTGIKKGHFNQDTNFSQFYIWYRFFHPPSIIPHKNHSKLQKPFKRNHTSIWYLACRWLLKCKCLYPIAAAQQGRLLSLFTFRTRRLKTFLEWGSHFPVMIRPRSSYSADPTACPNGCACTEWRFVAYFTGYIVESEHNSLPH